MKRAPTLTTREFAAEIGVGIKTVQRYVRTGKIDGPALLKDGHRFRIRPGLAKRQLAARLPPPTGGRASTGGARLTKDAEILNVRLKQELIRSLQLKNEASGHTQRGRAGRFVLASEVEGLLKRTVAETFASLEAHMPGFVAALADAFKIPQAEVAAMLGEHMKRVRAEATAIREPGTINGKGH